MLNNIIRTKNIYFFNKHFNKDFNKHESYKLYIENMICIKIL